MNKIILSHIKTDQDLRTALITLDRRWRAAFDIKDPRKREGEVLRLRSEIRYVLDELRRIRISTNLKNNSDNNFFNKVFKNIVNWLRKIEREHRDDQRGNR